MLDHVAVSLAIDRINIPLGNCDLVATAVLKTAFDIAAFTVCARLLAGALNFTLAARNTPKNAVL